jgi:hypothetical protein
MPIKTRDASGARNRRPVINNPCMITHSQLFILELELELIQTQMTQKPMLRAEVYARALRASQNREEDSV